MEEKIAKIRRKEHEDQVLFAPALGNAEAIINPFQVKTIPSCPRHEVPKCIDFLLAFLSVVSRSRSGSVFMRWWW